MKSWTKKVLALALCLFMLTAMIPFGIFSASGLDYSKSEFVISNANDWNDIATYAKENSATFAGKTIKLGQSVDFGGATIPMLIPSSFSGTFDGQGYTISNFNTTTGAIITNAMNGSAVIKNLNVNGTAEYYTYDDDGISDAWQVYAGMVANLMQGGNITDVSVAGSITSNAYNVGAVVGAISVADGKSATVTNINVSATVHNVRTRASTGWHAAGGVVGNVETFGHDATFLIKNVNMSGTVTRDLGPAGGIIGAIEDKDGTPALYTAGTITVENCHVTGTVSSALPKAGYGVGGIVGAFGAFKRDSGDYFNFDGTLNISNCAVSGTVQNTSTSASEPVAVGGLIGSMAYCGATVNVNHCLVAASFPSQSLTATNGQGAGTILGAAASQSMSSLNVNNCVTTASGANMIGHSIAREGQQAAWFALNGKEMTSVAAENTFAVKGDSAWYYTNGITDNSVVTVSATAAETMIKKSAAGFINRVGGQITALAVQDNVEDGATLTSNETFAIRFIGISHVAEVASAKMTVIVRDAESGDAYKKYEKACNLYDALNAYDVNGQKLNYYKAADFGANKFLALTIGGIPAGTVDYTFDFTPSYTTADGLVVTGETVSITYDKNGQYVKERESFDALDLPSAPSVRIMSSNILVVDLDQTDYTNFLTDHEQRLANMATLYNFYQPDFIGLQEVTDATKVNGTNCFDGVKTMQSVLLSYMNANYKYVDFSDKLGSTSHFTPIMYDSAKWTPVAHDYDTTNSCNHSGCTMHRWQWALFQSVTDPAYKVIVFNLHGPSAETLYHGDSVKTAFYTDVNTQIKALEAAHPSVPIFVTGDYNAVNGSTYITTMTSGTSLKSEAEATTNCEPSTYGGIDHIYMTQGDATVKQFRQITDLKTIKVSTDHAPVYMDVVLNKITVPQYGSSMDWENGTLLP